MPVNAIDSKSGLKNISGVVSTPAVCELICFLNSFALMGATAILVVLGSGLITIISSCLNSSSLKL